MKGCLLFFRPRIKDKTQPSKGNQRPCGCGGGVPGEGIMTDKCGVELAWRVWRDSFAGGGERP